MTHSASPSKWSSRYESENTSNPIRDQCPTLTLHVTASMMPNSILTPLLALIQHYLHLRAFAAADTATSRHSTCDDICLGACGRCILHPLSLPLLCRIHGRPHYRRRCLSISSWHPHHRNSGAARHNPRSASRTCCSMSRWRDDLGKRVEECETVASFMWSSELTARRHIGSN